jgi:hypothetical protein
VADVGKQGTLLILSSVFGGSVALIGVFVIHCFILRYLHRYRAFHDLRFLWLMLAQKSTISLRASHRSCQRPRFYGSNLSARLSKQGTLLILSSVFGGSVALIGVFVARLPLFFPGNLPLVAREEWSNPRHAYGDNGG